MITRTPLRPALLNHSRMNLDYRRDAIFAIFEGISNQILKQLSHLRRICFDEGQLADFNTRILALDSSFKVGSDFARYLPQVNLDERARSRLDPGEHQEVVNQRLHTSSCRLHTLQIIVPLRR